MNSPAKESGASECAPPVAEHGEKRVAAPGEFAPLELGPLRVWPPVVLAPMAGVTNYPFRALCREFGAGLYVSEMITARGWLHGNRTSRLLARPEPSERPRSMQIYGADPRDLGAMVAELVDEGIDHLDLNLGCPVPKVTRAGGGCALALKPKLVARLVSAMTGAARGVPVTVKMRKGIDEGLLTFRAAASAAASEGAAAIGLHARTAAQLYSGEADWNAIGELKANLDVPVLGNGDVWECWDALRMLRTTGCDGVIVGRGCLGRPWLFRELATVFDGRLPDPPPALGAVVEIMLDHAERLVAHFGPVHGVRQFRKWTSWYTKGFRGSAALRSELQRITSLDDLRRLVAHLDPAEPFPVAALRVSRAKGSRTQVVRLPEGYLGTLDDDRAAAEADAVGDGGGWEGALSGG
jgi:nifR3 family TIM-barrel protein